MSGRQRTKENTEQGNRDLIFLLDGTLRLCLLFFLQLSGKIDKKLGKGRTVQPQGSDQISPRRRRASGVKCSARSNAPQSAPLRSAATGPSRTADRSHHHTGVRGNSDSVSSGLQVVDEVGELGHRSLHRTRFAFGKGVPNRSPCRGRRGSEACRRRADRELHRSRSSRRRWRSSNSRRAPIQTAATLPSPVPVEIRNMIMS